MEENLDLPPNVFTTYDVERHHERLQDADWLAQQLRAPTTRFLVVHNGEHLIANREALQVAELTSTDAASLFPLAESITFLGRTDGRTYVALGFSSSEPEVPAGIAAHGHFQNLRSIAPLIDHRTVGLLAYAQAMVYWHHRNLFCGVCGHPNESAQGGHLRSCTHPDCSAAHFPRTDPAIIVLITHDERCLLARQPHWPAKRYSIIAGFVEPGESLEEAVAREVREETGLELRRITYQSSQPWPFPKSLMLGFFAEAVDDHIHCHDGELEDVRWISRRALKAALENGELGLPSLISISRRLITQWFDAGQIGPLAEVDERLAW
jgi:NAD+ diphosphatase